MPFAVPMVWREATDHISNCYFCMTPSVGKGLSKKKRQSIQYPNIPSAIRPVPHRELLPVPEPPERFTLDSEDEESLSLASSSGLSKSQESYDTPCISNEPHLITQNELHDLIGTWNYLKLKQNFWALGFNNGILWQKM